MDEDGEEEVILKVMEVAWDGSGVWVWFKSAVALTTEQKIKRERTELFWSEM